MSEFESPVIDRSLRGRALRSAGLTFVRYGGAQVIRLASNLVLTRLLFAEAFGLMALVAVLLQGLHMLSDVGIRPSIVRSRRGDDPVFLDTLWTVQVIRGFVQFAIACIAAVPFARFYGEPLLAQMIPVAALSAVVLGFGSTKQYTQDRALRLGRLVVMEITAQASGTVLMIALALAFRSVWALIYGALFSALVRTLLSFAILPGSRNRFRWDPQARTELYAFGRWVFVSTMLTFTALASDRLIFGKLFSLETLGVYSIGKMLATAPTEAVSQLSMSVVFPLLSRVVGEGRSPGPAFASARKPVLIGAGFALSGLAATGDTLIGVLYDPRYAQAGWVLQVLAVSAWFAVVGGVNMSVLLALGESKWMAAAAGVKTVGMLCLTPLGAQVAGFQGAVMAIAAAEVLTCVVAAAIVSRKRLARPLQDVPLTLWVLSSVVVGAAAPAALSLSGLPALLVSATVVALAWLPLGAPLVVRLLRDREALLAG